MRRAEMKCIVAAGTLALACIPPAALAQAYPGKPIRIVIPFVAGGSSDIVGRAIGSKFQEFLRQPAVVENRPGANGDRKSTRLNSSHGYISYAVFCLKKKKKKQHRRNILYLH